MNTTSPNHSELWTTICTELQNVISADAVKRWFVPLSIESYDGTTLVLHAENSIYQYWIEDSYLAQLENVVTRVLESKVKIEFSTPEAPVAEKKEPDQTIVVEEPAPRSVGMRAASGRGGPDSSVFNPRNTFETFVVGNNQFAHAAAHAVASSPARAYNPLFLHGSVGLGKTHLMQAVGHHIIKTKKHLRVAYVTSEQFTNEFISAIQHGDLIKFRKSYRLVDVLLIDDIQFLAGKERSQDEFFHTFNTLFDGSKQIVLTSDSPPNDIANLEKRLSSRFEWGMTAELSPPDFETRLAILSHKMSTMSIKLDDDVLSFIARRVKSNVRRLEGALTRVAAQTSLSDGRKLSNSSLESLLKDLLHKEVHTSLSIDVIQKKVAETYDIRLADMTSKRRPANIALPRMVAMYLSRKLTTSSLSEIGDAFGGRDHGTVLHANRSIEEKMKADDKLRQTVTFLTEKLETNREAQD
ncbi:MAG: chromosomal replication initiator protein DnaA [Candidatus Methylacidiphilales bacterium]|nr:chromosomal replication initiator protein DnaA [Candidatus Methylacidiphilales bacterium]